MREIVVVSPGRSGTNYLLEALQNFREVFVALELFSAKGVYGIDPLLGELSAGSGIGFTGREDPRLRALFAERPGEALDLLRACAARQGHVAVAYKVLAHQLPAEALAAILARPGVGALFVVRQRLDVYASFQKANRIQRWQLVDTTDTRVPFAIGDFLGWASGIDATLALAMSAVPPGARRIVAYEDVVDTDLASLVRTGRMLLEDFGVGVAMPEAPVAGGRHFRQDRTGDSFGKFLEPERVRRVLTEAGLLDYATARFLDG
jgi:hypothetical protein